MQTTTQKNGYKRFLIKFTLDTNLNSLLNNTGSIVFIDTSIAETYDNYNFPCVILNPFSDFSSIYAFYHFSASGNSASDNPDKPQTRTKILSEIKKTDLLSCLPFASISVNGITFFRTSIALPFIEEPPLHFFTFPSEQEVKNIFSNYQNKKTACLPEE